MADNFEVIAGHPTSHLIIHVPHSARYIPEKVRGGILLGDADLESELDEMTDSLTAEMVLHATANLVSPPTLFINKYSSAEQIEIWNGFMHKRGWRDAATEGLIRNREESGLGHREDLVTFFDLMDVEEGRAP